MQLYNILYFADGLREWIADDERRVLVDAEALGNAALQQRPNQSHLSTFIAQLALQDVVGVEQRQAAATVVVEWNLQNSAEARAGDERANGIAA